MASPPTASPALLPAPAPAGSAAPAPGRRAHGRDSAHGERHRPLRELGDALAAARRDPGGAADSIIGRGAGPDAGERRLRRDPADERVRAYRRRRREVVGGNEALRRVLGAVAAVTGGAALALAWLADPRLGAVATPLLCGSAFAGAAFVALRLLNRRVERGRGLSANAIVWGVLSPVAGEAARRARDLDREASELRHAGLSTD